LNRFEIDIKLRPDIVPSPYALIVTRLGINDISVGLTEYDALRKIHDIFNTSNQINIGYNSLSFDNNMLRFGFYRNLLDPYSHQYKNNTYRADAMHINLIYYLYKNDVISWTDERPIKLENINQENMFIDGKSHDAMVDVEVMLELCRVLKSHDMRMWDYLINGFIKNIDITRSKKLPTIDIGGENYQIGIYTDIKLGYDNNCCCVAICLGRHSEYSNQSLWLKIDYNDISDYLVENDKSPRLLKRKDGEPCFILPWNQSYDHVIDDVRKNNVIKNIEWLNNNSDALNKFSHESKNHTYDKIENLDIDSSIYEYGLFKGAEGLDIKNFHRVTSADKVKILDSVSSKRVHALASRILFRNFSNDLEQSMKNQIKESIANQNFVNTKQESRRTPADALQEVNSILSNEDLDKEQSEIITDFVSYLNELAN
tara:strand:+ start:5420 stop:6703 length:1284 start_codon:yes stop_codon:yes gene_type:complete